MLPGYNTNGLAHHRWDDALQLIAEAGYRSVAITVDHHCLSPDSSTRRQDLARMAAMLQRCGLRCVIETGARFLLDPRRKHQPTLLSTAADARQQRRDFLIDCIGLAAELQADAVSFWSGSAIDATPPAVLWSRLVDECRWLSDIAGQRQVRLAFEPEPGMFLETCDQFAQLRQDVDHPQFGLTLDIGHVHCLQDGGLPDRMRQFADCLWNIHLEDMAIGVHEHLPFGAGTIDFPPVFQALCDIDYRRGLHVELSRDSHRAPTALRESFDFLAKHLTMS